MAGLKCLEQTVRVLDVDEQNHEGNLITEKLELFGEVNDEYSDFSAFLGGRALVTLLSINFIEQDFRTRLRAALS